MSRRVLEIPFVDMEYRTAIDNLFINPGPDNILDEVKAEAKWLFELADTAVKNDPSRYISYSYLLKEKSDVLFFLDNRASQGALPPAP